jgi:hypothetical protein
MTEELKASTTLADVGVYEHGGGTDDPMVLYFRVSTAKQGADGLGIDAQKQMCINYLNGGKWKVIGEFIEVESGGKSEKERKATGCRAGALSEARRHAPGGQAGQAKPLSGVRVQAHGIGHQVRMRGSTPCV